MSSCESLAGWDTWSYWTPCDGDHQQHRKRTCLQHGPGMCQGPTRETRDCLPDCMGNGEFVGTILSYDIYETICYKYNIFTFKQFDQLKINIAKHCIYFFSDINALPSSVENSGVTVGAVVGSCVISFIIGLALTAVLCFCYLKRRKPSIPGSPHYISKQNSYVIVPLKEVRFEEACLTANRAVFLHRYFKKANSCR